MARLAGPVTDVDVGALRRARAGTRLRTFEIISRAGIGDRPTGADADRFMTTGWQWSGVEPVSLVPPIDWDLPAADRSRRFRLQAWVPLTPFFLRYDETGDTRYLDFAFAAATDWVDRHAERADSDFAWYDVAVGWRAQRLGYLVDAALRCDHVPDAALARLVRSIGLHAEQLADDDLVAWHSNHGFLMAAGQLTLARRFPDLGLEPLADQAERRLAVLLDQQFAGDGGHREHSPGYHALVLRTLIGLVEAGVVRDPAIRVLRHRSEEALAWLVQPTGRVAMFGDTEFRQLNPAGAEATVADPALVWAVSNGRAGHPPERRTRALRESGYAVARTWTAPAEASHLALTAAFHSRTHKHADDGAILWCEQGLDLLIDGGRYGYVGRTEPGSDLARQGFWYSHPARVYAESTRAHSTVEIDGRSHPRAGVPFYGSGIGRTADDGGCLGLEAVVAHGGTHEHRRIAVLRPREWLLVLDELCDPGGASHEYVQRFLFGLRLELLEDEAALGFALPGRGPDNRLWVVPLDGAEPVAAVRGQEEPELLGWVSRYERELEPCWTAGFARAGPGRVRMATLLALAPEPPRATGADYDEEGGGELRWSLGAARHEVRLGYAAGAPLSIRHRTLSAAAPGPVARFRAARRELPPRPHEALMPSEQWSDGRVADADRLVEEGWRQSRFPALRLRAPVAWDEVCAANRSWHYHLHAWEPLALALRAHEQTGEARYLDYALPLVLDWLEQYPSLDTESPFAWYDMAVGLRAYRLGYILDVVARDDARPDEVVERLVAGARLHAEVLADDSRFRGHNNHGLYQAAGQLALALRFEELEGMAAAAGQGTARLRRMVELQFGADGAHREHSPGYHYLVLETLERLLAGGLLADAETVAAVARARAALPWFVQPRGSVAAIGDTSSTIGPAAPFAASEDPALRFVATAGAAGEPPAERLRGFTDTGYVAMREQWTAGEGFADAGHLVQIAGFHSRTHKHADDLSFTWCERGAEVLIDAGRFGYLYDDPRRRYVESTRAHNTVLVDGADRSQRDEDAYGSGVRGCGESDGVWWSETGAPAGPVEHRRVLLWHPRRWLVVLDTLADPAGASHTFAQRFLVAPEHDVAAAAEGHVEIAAAAPLGRLQVRPFGDAGAVEVARGQEEPELLGWVSRRYLELEPAPTFAFVPAPGPACVMAALFSWGEDDALPEPLDGDLAAGGRAGRLTWRQGGDRHVVELAETPEGDLSVRYVVAG